MLPKWHIFWGAVFALLVWLLFEIGIKGVVLIFLAAVFIDFDHYLIYAYHKKRLGLKGAFRYYEELGRREARWIREKTGQKSHLHVFHTIEFHLLILILAWYFPIFYYLLIGMVFHSLLDVVWLSYYKAMSLRWYFFFQWLFVKKSLKRKLKL